MGDNVDVFNICFPLNIVLCHPDSSTDGRFLQFWLFSVNLLFGDA